MGMDIIQLETAVTTISQEYLLEFTSEYGISEDLHPELPGPEERIVDFPKGKPLDSLKNWNNRFFWVDERVFPTIVDWRTSAPKDGMPAENTYSTEAVMILNTHRTPIQKQPEALLFLTGLSRRYYLRDEVYGLFSLICAPNPTKVKTGTRLRATHEVPLLTVTASQVIEMEDPAATTNSSGVPSTIERSHLDFANENPSQQSTRPEDKGQVAVAPEVPPPENVTTKGVALEVGLAEGIAATGPHVVKKRRKRGNDGIDTNTPPKVPRRDHADAQPTKSTHRGKSLAAIGLGMRSTRVVPASQDAPVDVSDPDPLSFTDPQLRPTADVTQSSKGTAMVEDPKSENTSFTSMAGSPEWGITNGCLLDAPEACQDLVDHMAPPRYFSELHHLHNDDFLKQYNVNLARKVAMRSQLWLRFEQEAKLLKKYVAQVARRDKRIQVRENEIKNLETLLEAETDMKKAAEGKSAELSKELENLRALFSDLQVSNNHLSQQVSTLQAQVMGEEKMKAAFKEFKQYEDNRVEQRSIAGCRWVIEHGLHLVVMKCGESTELRQAFADVVLAGIAKGMSEGLKYGVKHRKANISLEAIEAYDPEAEAKYIMAPHALKDLKYPIVDQLESLKDALIDAREPIDPWACKEEILLANAIAANVSHAEKKKKCRVVCRTHGVGFAHHARSDGVLVSVPTVASQGLAILLANAATQTEIFEDGAFPRSLCIHTQRLGYMSVKDSESAVYAT
nr:hypothetical protein [Tanacetum cinerariifolium]